MKKILYCYKYGILGGVCTQLINRLEVLGPAGSIEADIVFWKDMGISRTLDGYTVRFERDPAAFRKMAASGYDIVVVIDTPEYLEALSGFDAAPVITEIHTTTELGLEYLQGRTWKTSGYIVPSEYSRRMLHERFGVGDDAPIRVVPNSIDPRLFPKADVGGFGSRPIFGWVGKLDDHKDWRTMLELAARIVRKNVDPCFWIVGGETASVSRVDEFIDECQRLGLHPHIRWFPRIEYRAMHRVYAAIRDSGGAAIVTSVNESFGMSVLEALICGCPVVASRVGALPELGSDRAYLKFYELGDVDSAAETAVSLLGDGDARGALDADRDRLLTTYSAEAVGARYMRALDELCGGAASCTQPVETTASAR